MYDKYIIKDSTNMASYVYTANSSPLSSANIATDKVRIATTTSAIQFVASYPKVTGTGTVTVATSSKVITGNGTSFSSQVGVGYWIGNATGVTVGIVQSVGNSTSVTLAANANVAITAAGYTINPFGVPYQVATANSEIIPANGTERSVYVGQGNIISYLNVTGSAGAFSVTELGAPYANTGTSGVLPTPANGGPST